MSSFHYARFVNKRNQKEKSRETLLSRSYVHPLLCWFPSYKTKIPQTPAQIPIYGTARKQYLHSNHAGQISEEIFSQLAFVLDQTGHGRSERCGTFVTVHLKRSRKKNNVIQKMHIFFSLNCFDHQLRSHSSRSSSPSDPITDCHHRVHQSQVQRLHTMETGCFALGTS